MTRTRKPDQRPRPKAEAIKARAAELMRLGRKRGEELRKAAEALHPAG